MKWKIAGKIGIFLAFVVMLSGCTNLPNFPVSQGGVQKPQTEQAPEDLIVIDNIQVTPSVVYPGSSVTVRFQVKHIGDPKTSDKVKVTVKAYDFGPCTPTGQTQFDFTIYPGETKFLEVNFKAPSKDIGLTQKCPVRIKVNYSYTAKTQVEAYVMSEDKFTTLEKAGKSPYYTPKQSVGIGPVKIYFEFAQPQPFIAKKEDNKADVTFLVYAKNLGNGDVENEKVFLNINTVGGGTTPSCPNNANLQFIQGETRKVMCEWKPELKEGEEKMYYLLATMGYRYYYEKVVNVEVQPLPK